MLLDVVSWNLHGVPVAAPRRTRRMKLAAKRLRSIDPQPDIIVLQEIFFPSDLRILEMNLGDDYVTVDDIPRREYPPWFLPLANLASAFLRFRKSGLVAFVHRRWEITGAAFVEFDAEDLEIKFWEGDGYADKGFHRIDLRHRERGDRLTVFNTHTQSRRRQHVIRAAQITQLAAAAYAVDREVPVLIAGDFNVRPKEPLYGTMRDVFRWQDLSGSMESCGERFGYEESRRERIAKRRDYVFALTNARWRFRGTSRFICNLAEDMPYSDHHGLESRIEVLRDATFGMADDLANRNPDVRVPLALLAARALRGPSTRRTWLMGLGMAMLLPWRDRGRALIDALRR